MLRQLSAVSYQLSVFLLIAPPFGRKWRDFAPVLWAGGSLLTILTNGLTTLYPGLSSPCFFGENPRDYSIPLIGEAGEWLIAESCKL
jgi:hypothetical protein